MPTLDAFLSEHLSRGRLHFTREELLRALSASSNTLTASLSKLARKGRIANPRPGFYLILTPQDREAGAPDPERWIHALMKHQGTDYRISLLAAGRHRIEFIAQAEKAFTRTNRGERLAEMKTDSGTAKVAGIELTLLDCANWFHRAGGISAVGSIARDLGGKALGRRLTALAGAYEGTAVRRLGYLRWKIVVNRQVKREPQGGPYAGPWARIAAGEPMTRLSAALQAHRERILELARIHGARNVRVFGSAARGADREGSDLDLLVDVDDKATLFTLAGLQEELSRLLDLPVDVRTPQEISRYIRERVLAEARPL